MPPRARPRLSVVVVTYNEREALQRTLPALLAELSPADELIVSDNASSDGTVEVVGDLAPAARVVRGSRNRGFPHACNAGAEVASGDLILLLNPDAVVAPGFGEAIRRPLEDGRGWAAWMALVTMDEGRLVNTSGGIVHFTGISWAGEIGRPVAEISPKPREVAFASGACLAVPRRVWQREGGLSPHFFLYFDDVDFSLRLRLVGERVGLEPTARVDHAYDFGRRKVKWRMLERNRWATIVRTYPTCLLVLLAPALVLTEVGIVAVSIPGGWTGQKLLAMRDTGRALPRLRRERRAIQRRRRVGSAQFAASLTSELSSPYLGRAATWAPLRLALRAYWRAVRLILGAR